MESDTIVGVSVERLLREGSILAIDVRIIENLKAVAMITRSDGTVVNMRVGQKTFERILDGEIAIDDHGRASIYAYEDAKGFHLRYGKSEYAEMTELFGEKFRPKQTKKEIKLREWLNEKLSKN